MKTDHKIDKREIIIIILITMVMAILTILTIIIIIIIIIIIVVVVINNNKTLLRNKIQILHVYGKIQKFCNNNDDNLNSN